MVQEITMIETYDAARILNGQTEEWDTGYLTIYRRKIKKAIIPITVLGNLEIIWSDAICVEPFEKLILFCPGDGYTSGEIRYSTQDSIGGGEWVESNTWTAISNTGRTILITDLGAWMKIALQNTAAGSKSVKADALLIS